jgi:hypothetical protein
MKQHHISFSLFLLVVISLPFLSCSKDGPQSQTNGNQKCNDPSCNVSNQLILNSYEIDANQWTGQQSFGCDFGAALQSAGGAIHKIYDVHVLYQGQDYVLTEGKTVWFLNGNLSLDGTRLSFSAYYNQLPFQSLKLLVRCD